MGTGKTSTFPEDIITKTLWKKMLMIWSLKRECLPGRQMGEIFLGSQAILFYFISLSSYSLSSGFCLHNLNFSPEGHQSFRLHSLCDYCFSYCIVNHYLLLFPSFPFFFLFWLITQFKVWKIDIYRETGKDFVVLIKLRNDRTWSKTWSANREGE